MAHYLPPPPPPPPCPSVQHYAQTVDVWKREFATRSAADRLLLLYLANDVMQNSRMKGMSGETSSPLSSSWVVSSRAPAQSPPPPMYLNVVAWALSGVHRRKLHQGLREGAP
jgi:hypothetical protein